MELEDIRLSQTDWDAFLRWDSPLRFDEIIDRSKLGFPSWLMPNARGAVVPSAQVLKPISGRRVPSYWSELRHDKFCVTRGSLKFTAQQFGSFWSLISWDGEPSTLAFHCGSTPVVLKTHIDAMSLWSQLYLKEEAMRRLGYCWLPIFRSMPLDLNDAIGVYIELSPE